MYTPEDEELEWLGVERSKDLRLFRAKGCAECTDTGYAGRIALFEVMRIHGEIRRLIEASTEKIFAAAVQNGMTTLRQDGVRVCLKGLSSFEEIRRVTGDRVE